MMRTIAADILRSLADLLDPPEPVLEDDDGTPFYRDIVEVEPADGAKFIMNSGGRQYGIPVCFWRIGFNGFRLWPLPDRPLKLSLRFDDVQ